MSNKPILFCDVDDVCFPLMTAILPLYNKAYDDNLIIDDIKSYNVHEFIKKECTDLFGEFVTEEFILNSPPIEGSVEILSELEKITDFYFLTAAFAPTIGWRDIWFKEHFKFYNGSMLIRCKNKKLIHGDVLVDDYYENIRDGHYKGVLFEQPWSKGIVRRGLKKISKWDDQSFRTILDALEINTF